MDASHQLGLSKLPVRMKCSFGDAGKQLRKVLADELATRFYKMLFKWSQGNVWQQPA